MVVKAEGGGRLLDRVGGRTRTPGKEDGCAWGVEWAADSLGREVAIGTDEEVDEVKLAVCCELDLCTRHGRNAGDAQG